MADKAGANVVNTLNGHFKEAYGDKIKNLIPDGVKVLNKIDFLKAEKQLGNFYNQPVILTHEHGFTYGGSDGNAFELAQAVNSISENAQIRGHEMVLRSYLSMAAATRSANSKTSFVSETKLLVENMLKSFARRLEVQLMYGQHNIGEVETAVTTSVKIEDHEWASGIWSGSENMRISIFSADKTTLRLSTSVVSVDLDTKTVVLAADAQAAGVIATDVIHYEGAVLAGPTYREFAGIHKIITNTGVIFGINASSYNLWKGNIVEVGTDFTGGEASLSFDKIETGVARAMAKGLMDEEVSVICAPITWKDLLTEQTAKRSYDSSYDSNKMEQGAKDIVFYGQNGKIEITSSIYCKEGYAYMIPVREFYRVGSTDVTFEQPGMEGKFVRLLENHHGYEMRLITDQALFSCAAGLCVMFTFIG